MKPNNLESPAQISDEPMKNLDLCDCGHRREKHHHGRGLCEAIRGSGFICHCSRFKHPKPPIVPENPNSDSHHAAARSRLEPVDPIPSSFSITHEYMEPETVIFPVPLPPIPSPEQPLKPNASLLVKLGSIAVHAEELTSPGGHHFDAVALQQLLEDSEVKVWLAAMDKMAFLPKKR